MMPETENTGFHTSSFYSLTLSIIPATLLAYRNLHIFFMFTILINVLHTPA